MSILLNCNWKKKHRRKKTKNQRIIKRLLKQKKETLFCGWKADPAIQEMESKARNVSYTKSEVGGLQMIKEC